MKVGYLLWEGLTLAVIIFGALAVFWLRGSRVKEERRFWICFSLLLFGVCMFGLAVGSLLSPYGFGWLLLVLVIVIDVVTKAAPKLLRPLR